MNEPRTRNPTRAQAPDAATQAHPDTGASTPERVGFLLMPGLSMLSFAAVLEPLRMVNRLRQTNLYEWQHFSPDDGPVPAH